MVAPVMAGPRVVRPIVRTYITQSTSPGKKEKVHARLYAPKYNLDKRGTGRSLDETLRRAKAAVK